MKLKKGVKISMGGRSFKKEIPDNIAKEFERRLKKNGSKKTLADFCHVKDQSQKKDEKSAKS